MMKSVIALLFSATTLTGYAQTVQPAKTDSVKTPAQAFPVSYDKVFSKPSLSRSGLFTVRQLDNKWYFEIPDSLMNRYILVVTRYKSVPAGFGSFGGEEANRQTIYFEKNSDTRIFLRALVNVQEGKDSTQALYKAVQTSSVNPITAVLDIKSINPTTKNYVVDVTDLFKKDNPLLGISTQQKGDKKLGGLAEDRTYITDIRTYPINVEITSVRTYNSVNPALSAAASTGVVTLETNTSMVVLPKVPMQRRLFDERVGYFANRFLVFDEDKQVAEKKSYIQRFRLEPKPEDLEKYKRGELVEPANPIVFYIDPATPKKWRPYLIAGVNDWQKAFEKAGFKNAIIGKEWPEQDSTMSLEDARFSVIRYYASETPNAYGPRIWDPRSGEIIESHVGWFHNVMKLVHHWYMVQAGALDPRARKMQFDDELMGDLIRFVSSHEVGHTIGLRHNMGASSATPVEKLRDKKWVEANGHTASIMDYARFNYVAQPEDNIGKDGIYPRIGDYDKWAIMWGYKQFYKGDENEESLFLNKLIVDSLAANPRLWFGGEGSDEDPRSQKEDLGDDVMKANEYGIKNLQRVVAALPAWTKTEGDLYSNLKEMHTAVVRQYSLYMRHVAKYVNARNITFKSVEEKGGVYQFIPREKMKSSMQFIAKHVYNPPLWLYPAYTKELLGIKPASEMMEQQNYYMQMYLNIGILANMQQNSLDDPKAYKVPEYLEDLKAEIWNEMPSDEKAAYFKRSIQRNYLERLGQIVYNKDVAEGAKGMNDQQKTDARIYALAHLKKLRDTVSLRLQQPMSALNRMHFTDMKNEMDKLIRKSSNQ